MNPNTIKSILIYPLVSLLCLAPGAQAQSATAVPSPYTTEYAQLEQVLANFITTLGSRKPVTSTPTIGCGLDSADGGKGLSLLQSGAIKNVQTQIACFKQLNVPAVNVSIGFPLACQEFWTQQGTPNDLKAMLSFYQQVVQLCHAAGIKVIVEAHPIYPFGSSFGQSAMNFTSALSASQFQTYTAEHINNIAATVQPDVISIVAEPETDLAWTTQTVYQQPQALGPFVAVMANQIATANAKNHTNIISAAGCDSWTSNAQAFDNQFYQIPALGAIDIHNYFVGNNDLTTATALADGAHAASKAVVVSECWLSKAGTGSPPSKPEANQAMVDRAVDSFSFWEPLDEEYLSAFKQWCQIENPAIFCFSYTQQLFTYLDYSTEQSLSDQQIVTNELQAASQAMQADQFSPVGTYFGKSIK